MAHIKSGQLYLTKKEADEIIKLVCHSKLDISYGDGGTYHEIKAVTIAEKAMETIKFILETAVIK